MSKLDYRFKEILVDPFVLDSTFPAPELGDNGEEEQRKEDRDRYVRSRMREVRKAMKELLTGRQRECLTLYYLRSYSQRRIAKRLGIHQTTVSQHISFALKKLRSLCWDSITGR